MSSRVQKLFLAILSGILLSLPFCEGFSELFLFVGLVPLLVLENQYQTRGTKSYEVLGYSLLCFLIWNIISTWWIGYATLVGASALIIFNSCLYASLFWLFHRSKQLLDFKKGNFLLIVYWLTFEFLYLRTEISWPWLDLGNGLAKSVILVQWYEYTGILGGTLWILMVNVLLSEIIIHYIEDHRFSKREIWIMLIIIVFPALLSVRMYNVYHEKNDPSNIVIIQPNIDPYHEKFTGISPENQLQLILKEASKIATSNTDYFIAPETAIQGYNLENTIEHSWAITSIKGFLSNYPQGRFIIGAETAKEYSLGEKVTHTAQEKVNGIWVDYYNSALQIDTGKQVPIYHKSQLVIGVEKIPFSKYVSFLKNYPIKIGGTATNLGYQENRETFVSPKGSAVAPIICYESVYGEYVTDYVKTGANLLVVITNDGWWKNTSGMQQHLRLSQIRAIETRRSLARSANTGISALINQRGDILQSIKWNQRLAIAGELNKNETITFYVHYGDYIGRIALYIFFALLGWMVWKKLRSGS